MRPAILILTFVGGILAAPLLCTAGVTEHECVCDSVECCAEEATCELDPCDAVYQGKDRREQDHISVGVLAPLAIRVEVLPEDESPTGPPLLRISGNRPFPDSDLPLRI